MRSEWVESTIGMFGVVEVVQRDVVGGRYRDYEVREEGEVVYRTMREGHAWHRACLVAKCSRDDLISGRWEGVA